MAKSPENNFLLQIADPGNSGLCLLREYYTYMYSISARDEIQATSKFVTTKKNPPPLWFNKQPPNTLTKTLAAAMRGIPGEVL